MSADGAGGQQAGKRQAASAADLTPFYSYVDEHASTYVQRLATAVAIPSVSADPERRPDCLRMIAHVRNWMDKLGIDNELRPLGQQAGRDNLELPPVVVGRLGTDPSKRTVGLYSHLDVQPAQTADGWRTDPFVLTEDADGRMYGRGSTDDKGPALAWLWAIEAFRELELELPVNIVFCFECMEESGSEGLAAMIERESTEYFARVDCWCISDFNWIGTAMPCLHYGLRGICYFMAEISGPAKDIHSGRGGMFQEPLAELVRLLDSLADPVSGQISVAGISELVPPVAPEERASFAEVDFDAEDYKNTVLGVPGVRSSSKVACLEALWRLPNLSIHGIEGAFSGAGCKTVIPAKVTGKFSIRLVEGMDCDVVEGLVKKHVEAAHAALGSPNRVRVWCEHAGSAFVQKCDDFNYKAGRRAIERVYGVPPNLTRSGGSVPVTVTFQQTGKSVLLMTMGRGDDGPHGPNEKLDRDNYLKGIKVFGAYLQELALGEGPPDPSSEGARKRRKTKLCTFGKCDPMLGCECEVLRSA